MPDTDEAGHKIGHTYDSDGNERSGTDAEGNTTIYGYDSKGNMTSIKDGFGLVTDMTYDANNNMETTKSTDGSLVEMKYDSRGKLQWAKDGKKSVKEYTYNKYGQVETMTVKGRDGKPDVKTKYVYEKGMLMEVWEDGKLRSSMTYYGSGLLKTKKDSKNNVTRFVYDDVGRLMEQTDPDGKTTKYRYNSSGEKTYILDKEGNETVYTFDNNNNVKTVRNARKQVTSFAYDDEDRLLKTTYANKTTTSNTYDKVGNVDKTTDEEGHVTDNEYFATGDLKSVLYPDGYKESFTYYPNGKVHTETNSQTGTVLYTYDTNWHLASIKDERGFVTGFVHDVNGNLLSETDPQGNTTTYEYDHENRLEKVIDAKNNVTLFTYDRNGNKASETNALNQVTQFKYNSEDQLEKVIKADGTTVSYRYNSMGQVYEAVDELGQITKLGYDNIGNVTKVTAPGNRVTETKYDPMGNVESVIDPMGFETVYQYDEVSRLKGIMEYAVGDRAAEGTQAAPRSTAYVYDKTGLMTGSEDNEGNTTSAKYNEVGMQEEYTNPNGGVTEYKYNSARNLLETKELNITKSYKYDAAGLMKESANGRGQTTGYKYDELGRIKSMTDAVGTVTYGYDEVGNIETVDDGKHKMTRTFDKLNRVKTATDYKGNTISYGYDQVGNLKTLTYPGGEIITYDYDALGRLTNVTKGEALIVKYKYGTDSRIERAYRPENSTLTTYQHDKNGQLLWQKDAVVKAGTEDAKTPEEIRVIQENSYEYNSAGNVTEKTSTIDESGIMLTSAVMEYGKDNRMLTYNGQTVKYDADGNMTYGPLDGKMVEYKYDCRNRLIEAGGETYTYDGENTKIASTIDGVTTEFVVNTNADRSQILTEQTGSKKTTYYYGNGLIGSQKSESGKASGMRYNHYDHLGSVVAITDETGKEVHVYTYGPYGELTSGDPEGERFLYNGLYGVETLDNGLYYMRARFYNVEIKRFLNQDVLTGSVGDSQSLNRYAYVQGNPINLIDPFGLSPEPSDGGGSGGGAGAGSSAGGSGGGGGGGGGGFMNAVHNVLSWVGMVPVIGDVVDIANGMLYLAEGDYKNAALSVAYALPFIGTAVAASVKVGFKAFKAASTVADVIKAGSIVVSRTFSIAQNAKAVQEGTKTIVQDYVLGGKSIDGNFFKNVGKIILGSIGVTASAKLMAGELNAMRAGKPCGKVIGTCFVAGTVIKTVDGDKNIEDIKVGDQVFSRSDETGETEYKEVANIFRKEAKTIISISYVNPETNESETLETTVGHPFWIEGEWRGAEDIVVGDMLTLDDGSQIAVTDVGVEQMDEPVIVYNFEVKDNHNYHVGQLGVWVHNDSRCVGKELSKSSDEIAHGGYYTRKKLRTAIYNAQYTAHGYKHIKAKTVEQAKVFSQTGQKHAQYLPSVNNKSLEKTALERGHLVEQSGTKGTKYFMYNAGRTIGYDEGVATSWIRAELASGFYHGHPISEEHMQKYTKQMND